MSGAVFQCRMEAITGGVESGNPIIILQSSYRIHTVAASTDSVGAILSPFSQTVVT